MRGEHGLQPGQGQPPDRGVSSEPPRAPGQDQGSGSGALEGGRLRRRGLKPVGLERPGPCHALHGPRLTAHGFQTDGHVRAEVPNGKKAGTHVGRVAVRAPGSFNIQKQGALVQGISHRHCRFVQCGGSMITKHFPVAGTAVGLLKDYGPAKQLYIKMGYIPDGLGATYCYQPVDYGSAIVADNNLVLWMTKRLR